MVYKSFDKNSKGGGVKTHANDKIKQSQRLLDLAAHKLAEELHKPVIRKLKKKISLFKIQKKKTKQNMCR